jgi:signal transduction histidine kinase
MSDPPQVALSTSPLLARSLRLLLVEDSPFDVELIVMTLERAGVNFTYDVADQVPLCLKYLQENTYDAVLSDYRLPGFTAYQTLESLQTLGLDIPLILVTGTLGEEAAVDCIKSGMTDYVLKERLFRLPLALARSLEEFSLRQQKAATIAQLGQQARREAIINRIVQAMHGTLVLDEVLQSTVDLLHEALGVSRCVIYRADSDDMKVSHISQATPEGQELLGISCILFSHFKEALMQRQQVALDCLPTNLPVEAQQQAQQFSIQATLMTALIYQDQYLGGICLQQCDRCRVWSSDEQELVRALADQCAIAIHQAQLFDQVQQQAQREQLLNQISQSINSSLDPEYILQEIVRLTGQQFQVDRVLIFAITADQIRITHEWLATDQVTSMLDFTAPVDQWFDVVEVPTHIQRSYTFHAPDYAALPCTPARLEMQHRQTLSLLSVPIFVRDQFFGGLDLYTTKAHRTFSEAEIHLLQRIANQAAIALDKAQSYEHLEHQVQERTRELEQEKLLSESANRAKTEFLTHMSHELRTPLTGVLGFASLLLKQVFGPLTTKQQQYIEGIVSCGQDLLALINDLLDLSKIEAGKEELFLEPVVVQEICDACYAITQEVAQSRGLEQEVAIDAGVTVCIADKRRLKQILCNLLANAVKFTESGSVSLNVTQTEEMIYFAVTDTGIGISADDQLKLFQSFQQLDGGLDRRYEGTGLGLALARKLAQLHGGDITVQSELGRGSCFTLQLPLQHSGAISPNP